MKLDKNVQELAEDIIGKEERCRELKRRLSEVEVEHERIRGELDEVCQDIHDSERKLLASVKNTPLVMEHSEKPGVIIVNPDRHYTVGYTEYRVVLFIPHERITPAARMAYFNL